MLKRQMEAANAHDTDQFLAPFLHNDSLVFVSEGEVIRGWNRLREQQLKWWNNGNSDIVYSEPAGPALIHLDAHTVVVTQQLEAHRKSSDDRTKSLKLVATTLWRESSAGWQIVYAHESFAH